MDTERVLPAEYRASLARRILVRPGEVHAVRLAEVTVMTAKGEIPVRPVGRTVHVHVSDGGIGVSILELGGRNGMGVLQGEQKVVRIGIVESVAAGGNDANGGVRTEEIVILILNDVDDRSLVVDEGMKRLGRHRVRLPREDTFPLPLAAHPRDERRRVFFVQQIRFGKQRQLVMNGRVSPPT